MATANLIVLMYGGLEKLGPGDDGTTRDVLSLLPRRDFELVLDVGCGSGRQTLVLARELDCLIHALDTHESFLAHLEERARDAGLRNRLQTHCVDMADVPNRFQNVDLIWAEGSAYSIGFDCALKTWKQALAKTGFLVVSELVWLTDSPPPRAKKFFESEYPAMRTVEEIVTLAEDAGYEVIKTHDVPHESWNEGYYDVLKPRAGGLLGHEDSQVREFAAAMLEEIAVYETKGESYGYVFLVLKNA